MQQLSKEKPEHFFQDYALFQAKVAKWEYPEYVIYGLAEEAMEFQLATRRTKEQFRGDEAKDVDEAVKKELGDVFFFWFANCIQFGFNPMDVIQGNVDKISARFDAGTIKGDGDNR